MNETEKKNRPPHAEPDMEMLREAVAAELRAMKSTESETAAEQPEVQLSPTQEEPAHVSFFRRAETLAQLAEGLGELREAVGGLQRELAELRAEQAAERECFRESVQTLLRENRELRSTLEELKKTDELIHMRVFDNRVRISEVKEALEDAEKRLPPEETEAEA